EDVALLQKQTTGNADGFLTFANVNAAGDVAGAIKADQLFLERAREQHPAKRFQKLFVHRRCLWRCFLGRRFFPTLRRLKHRPILRKIDNRAQNFFDLKSGERTRLAEWLVSCFFYEKKKSAIARARSPAREARALPRIQLASPARFAFAVTVFG